VVVKVYFGFDVGTPGADAVDPAVLVALVTDHGIV
jgi:hypothetical protein